MEQTMKWLAGKFGKRSLLKDADATQAKHLLLHGFPINSEALHDASVEKTRVLLDFKADPNVTNADGATPLLCTKDIPKMKLLVDHKADVNFENDGETPLSRAVKNDCMDAAKFLLACNANVQSKTLGLTIKNGNEHMLGLLLEHKADPNDSLHLANDCFEMQLLLDSKAKINFADAKGETALMKALRCKDVSTARLLCKYGANLDACDLLGNTAFDFAHDAKTHMMLLEERQRRKRQFIANFIGRDATLLVEAYLSQKRKRAFNDEFRNFKRKCFECNDVTTNVKQIEGKDLCWDCFETCEECYGNAPKKRNCDHCARIFCAKCADEHFTCVVCKETWCCSCNGTNSADMGSYKRCRWCSRDNPALDVTCPECRHEFCVH